MGRRRDVLGDDDMSACRVAGVLIYFVVSCLLCGLGVEPVYSFVSLLCLNIK